MNDLLLIIGGVALGTYFAEPVRKAVPILDPKKKEKLDNVNT